MPFTEMTSPYYILVEIFEQDDGRSGEDRLFSFLEKVGDLIEDGVVPHDEK